MGIYYRYSQGMPKLITWNLNYFFYLLCNSVLIAFSLFVTQMKQGSATSGTNNNNSFGNNIINNNNTDFEQQLQPQQQLSKLTHIVSEWDEGIIFDVDDPDFCPGPSTVVIDRLTTATNSCAAALRNLNLIGK